MKIKYIIAPTLFLSLLFSCKNNDERPVDAEGLDAEKREMEQEQHPLIQVNQPTIGTEITSPLKVSGRADASWFFEGVAQVELINDNGETMAKAQMQMVRDSIKHDMPPFEATLEFETLGSENGALLFHKANPSGLGKNSDSYKLPVIYRKR